MADNDKCRTVVWFLWRILTDYNNVDLRKSVSLQQQVISRIKPDIKQLIDNHWNRAHLASLYEVSSELYDPFQEESLPLFVHILESRENTQVISDLQKFEATCAYKVVGGNGERIDNVFLEFVYYAGEMYLQFVDLYKMTAETAVRSASLPEGESFRERMIIMEQFYHKYLRILQKSPVSEHRQKALLVHTKSYANLKLTPNQRKRRELERWHQQRPQTGPKEPLSPTTLRRKKNARNPRYMDSRSVTTTNTHGIGRRQGSLLRQRSRSFGSLAELNTSVREEEDEEKKRAKATSPRIGWKRSRRPTAPTMTTLLETRSENDVGAIRPRARTRPRGVSKGWKGLKHTLSPQPKPEKLIPSSAPIPIAAQSIRSNPTAAQHPMDFGEMLDARDASDAKPKPPKSYRMSFGSVRKSMTSPRSRRRRKRKPVKGVVFPSNGSETSMSDFSQSVSSMPDNDDGDAAAAAEGESSTTTSPTQSSGGGDEVKSDSSAPLSSSGMPDQLDLYTYIATECLKYLLANSRNMTLAHDPGLIACFLLAFDYRSVTAEDIERERRWREYLCDFDPTKMSGSHMQQAITNAEKDVDGRREIKAKLIQRKYVQHPAPYEQWASDEDRHIADRLAFVSSMLIHLNTRLASVQKTMLENGTWSAENGILKNMQESILYVSDVSQNLQAEFQGDSSRSHQDDDLCCSSSGGGGSDDMEGTAVTEKEEEDILDQYVHTDSTGMVKMTAAAAAAAAVVGAGGPAVGNDTDGDSLDQWDDFF